MIKRFITGILLCVAVLCFFSCRHAPHNITRGFYYWKTVYNPGDGVIQTLHSLHCSRMYIRLFDLDWDPMHMQTEPIGVARLPQHMDTTFTYVPVVFITQNVLTNIKDSSIMPLAAKIAGFIKLIDDNAGIHPPEIQIDCDWTGTTKEIYFALLRALRTQSYFKGKTLSCTIRMHQAKYTVYNGIPPADRGLLMCYNMGDIKKYGDRNSILDVADAKEYLKHINVYPLPLDIALPLFHWCLLFKDHKLKGILRDVPIDAVTSSPIFRHEEGSMYSCVKDTLWQGYYLQKGETIRTEQSTYSDIKKIAAYTAAHVKNKDINIVFFHCDSLILAQYPPYELEKIYDTYR